MFNLMLRKLRTACGISQVDLAAALGVSKQSVSNWENDNILPSIDILVRTAKFFSVTTDYLLGLDERQFIEVSGLNEEQLAHIRFIINDIGGKSL